MIYLSFLAFAIVLLLIDQFRVKGKDDIYRFKKFAKWSWVSPLIVAVLSVLIPSLSHHHPATRFFYPLYPIFLFMGPYALIKSMIKAKQLKDADVSGHIVFGILFNLPSGFLLLVLLGNFLRIIR